MTAWSDTGIRAGRAVWKGLGVGARRIRGELPQRPPAWESSLLDDVADNRPWNISTKVARTRARLRLGSLTDGVTIVIVNWNTLPVVQDVIETVQRFSPSSTRILVVDNGSTDGSREALVRRDDVDLLRLPFNVGHAIALDLALLLRVRTTIAVTLDSDAFPLRPGWLEPAVEPIRSGDAKLTGLRSSRGFVHPVYLAVDVRTFVRRGLSFQVYVPESAVRDGQRWGENCWDTAELMSQSFSPSEIRFIDPQPNAKPGLPGMSVGDVVYHHGGVTRETTGAVSESALREWKRARHELLGA